MATNVSPMRQEINAKWRPSRDKRWAASTSSASFARRYYKKIENEMVSDCEAAFSDVGQTFQPPSH